MYQTLNGKSHQVLASFQSPHDMYPSTTESGINYRVPRYYPALFSDSLRIWANG